MAAEIVRLDDARAKRVAEAAASRAYHSLHRRCLGMVGRSAANEMWLVSEINRVADKIIADFGHLDDAWIDQVLGELKGLKRQIRARHLEAANFYFEMFPTSDLISNAPTSELLERLMARSER